MSPVRRMTLLIIPEAGGRTYEYKVARWWGWAVVALLVALLVVLAIGLNAMVQSQVLARHVDRLKRDKDILIEEVQRVDYLEVTLQRLKASNAQLRQITFEAVGLHDSGPSTATNRIGEQLITVVDRLRYGRLRTVPTLTPVRAAQSVASGSALIFRAPPGSLVRASAAGRVVVCQVGADGIYQVDLDHGNGVLTQYRGLSTPAVEDGQFVQKGQPLGLSGSQEGIRFVLIEGGQPRQPQVGELWL